MPNTTRRRCTDRPRQLRDALACMMVFAGAALGVEGCSSRSGTTSPSAGSLTVTIVAPEFTPRMTPHVTVSGPGGLFTRTLSATTTLTGLAVGSYTVVADTVTTTDPIVGTVYTGTVSRRSVSVTANETEADTAAYLLVVGTGGLWAANAFAAQSVARIAAADLTNSGNAPAPVIKTGDPRPFGVAFDASGNLWVALSHGNLVVEYARDSLYGIDVSARTATFTLGANAGSLSQPAGLAFDASGNLWVSNGAANTVVEFSAGQLHSGVTAARANGTPAPVVTIGASSGSLSAPLAIAFDVSDNLWVANANAGTVVEFSAAQLAASGTPSPAVTLSASAGSIVGPTGLAFDASGNLWVANGNTGHNTVVEFSASQLTSSGATTAAVVLSASAGSLASPTGLAFDNSGSLWVANGNDTVVEFTTNQLGSGSPTPTVVITVASQQGMPVGGIAFDRPSPNLPLPPPPPPGPWDY